jgi:hypothetical protein
MQPKTKATIYGLLLAVSVAGLVGAFPMRVGDAFTCFAGHLSHMWLSQGNPMTESTHFWPRYLWPWLCLWVVSLALAIVSIVGLLSILGAAKKNRAIWERATFGQKRP